MTKSFLIGAALAAAAGLPVSVFAQESPPQGPTVSPAAQTPTAQAPSPAQPPTPSRPTAEGISFNFKDAPVDQVLDFFARESGLPVIFEAQAPQGTITFVSAGSYSLDDAMSILNLNLARFNVHLRRQDKYLYLASIQDAMRRPVPMTTPADLAAASPDKIVTVAIPLQNAQAQVVVEQIKPLVGPLGGVMAIPPQNLIILVESAAQAKRLRDIVESIDAVRPVDAAYRIFPLRHAQCDTVVNALKGLIGERVVTTFIDKDGRKTTAQEVNVAGLNLQADPRTNSIIAVGSEARIGTVEELLVLLDVPETAGDQQMATYTLGSATPQEVSQRIDQLFSKVEAPRRPTVIPLPQAGKVTVVGSSTQLAQVVTLLAALDPDAQAQAGRDAPAAPERRAVVIALRHATPAAVEGVARTLLNPRQAQVVKFAPGPDGRSLAVAGPDADVRAFEQLVAGLDVPRTLDRDVRLMRISQGDPGAVLARATSLYEQTGRSETEPVSATLDASSGTVTLIGSRAGLAAFDQILSSAQAAAAIDLETRTFRLDKASPSQVAQKLARLARPLLAPPDGGVFAEPAFEPLDELKTLVVRAQPGQFQVLSGLVGQLDHEDAASRELRIVQVTGPNARDVLARAERLYAERTRGLPEEQAGPVGVEFDERSAGVLLTGRPGGVRMYADIINQVQQLAGPARSLRMIELRHAKASTTVAFLRDLVESSQTLKAWGGPRPEFEAIEATNSIMVAAEPGQFAIVEALARGLDSQQTADRPPLRIFKLRATDAANLAAILQQNFDARPVEQRNARPATIEPDAATNTLVVSAHADLLPEIERLVKELNEQQALDAEGREIRIFPLKVARADELAQTIDQMFPDPPAPLDPRTRQPRPDLKPPREVVVRADRATNSIIVDAPAKRLAGFEEIVRALDSATLAGNVELRTYRVERADLNAAAATIRNLAAGGSLGPQGGASPPVTVSTEPVTRTLVVSGPSEVFTRIEDVLKRIDSMPQRPSVGIRMYPLRAARADRLATVVQRMLATRLREEQAAGRFVGDPGGLLDIATDAASNTLIISAPESVQTLAEELIRALDTDSAAAGRTIVRVIPLSFADATQTAATLSQAAAGLDLPSGGRVGIVAAPGSNALVLTGAEADLNKVEELVKPLDVRPEGAEIPTIETFSLKHAEAGAIARTVENLLVQQQETDPRLIQLQLQLARQGRADLFRKPMIKVEASQRTNSLVVSAPRATVELAKSVIERLDVPDSGPPRKVSVFTPARARAQDLAASVSRVAAQTLPQERTPVELTADASSGSVIVIGTDAQVQAATRLLSEFDDRSVALPAADVQSIEIVNVDAAALAGTVQAMLTDRTRWPEELRRAERAGLPVPAPAAVADAKSNRLILSVPSVLMPVAKGIIASLDQPAAKSNVGVRVFRLDKGKADSAANALRQGLVAAARPGDPSPTVSADAASNTLVVSGSPALLDRAAELVKEVDQGVAPDGMGVRTVYLKHARAEAVAPVVEAVLTRESAVDRLPVWMRSESLLRGETPPVKVAAEPRLNALVVSGPAGVLDVAEQLAQQLDADPGPGGGDRPVRIVTLTNADAAELAASLDAVFKDDRTGQPAPTIRVDKSSNSLIVRATPEQLRTVDELASRLDSATLGTSRQLRLIPLDRSRADAETMARTLQRLLEQQGGVKVEVISTEELLRKTQPQPQEPRKSGRLPGRGGAGPLAPAVRALVTTAMAVQGDAQPGQEPQPGVTIAVDRATNSLVILGSPRVTDRLAALAHELEKQLPAEPASVHVVTLPAATDAQPIADVVRAAIDRIGRTSAANPGGLTGPVAVVPDPSGAALIVLGNDTDFEVVGRLIASVAQLDAATPVTVKVYPLTTATAPKAIAAVRDLFSPDPRGAQGRRVRQLDISLAGPDGPVTARIDPALVRMTPDPSGSSLLIAAPSQAFPLIDRLIEAIDQAPVTDRLAIRRYPLSNAKADELSRTFQSLFDAQRQGAGAGDLPRAQFVADARTNSLLVTAADPQHADVVRLLEAADAALEQKDLELAIIPLRLAAPSTVQRIVEEVLIGRDPAKKDRVRVSAQDGSSLFVVRAPRDDVEEVRRIVAEIDATETGGLPVRSIKLERADAQQVAAALQRFFQDRAGASSRLGTRVTNRVAVVGDRRSGTLVVSASDEEYAQVESLVKTFDAPTPSQDYQFKVITLKHARVSDIGESIRNVIDEMRWDSQPRFIWWGGPSGGDDQKGVKVYVEPNERTNSIVVVGQGDMIPMVERVVAALDVPESDRGAVAVRSVEVRNADPNAVRAAIQRAYQTPGWRSWRGPDPDAVAAEVDRARRAVILVGRAERVEQAAKSIQELDGAGPASGRIESITLEHARADRAAQSLRQFFADRARAQGLDQPGVSVVGSPDGNVIIVSADEANLAVLRDLVAQIDQPDAGKDRRIEVYVLRNASPTDAAGVLRQMFARPGRGEEQVVITPQPSTNSLIVSAPAASFEQIEALLKQLDAAPTPEEANIATVALNAARAREVAQALKAALPQSVKVTITPVDRTNSLMLTGSPEAIRLVMDQIKKIDADPVKSGLAFRRFRLRSADAIDVAFTLEQMLRARPRTPGEAVAAIDYTRADNTVSVNAPEDQIEDIAKIIQELDQPAGEERITEFVKLRFAKAETAANALKIFYGRSASEAPSPGARNVTILADTASNSLVISGEKGQWEGIRALLSKLDSSEYDTSRQIAVIPLVHAEAASVARALNEGLRAPIEDRARREQARAAPRPADQRRPNDAGQEPTVLVDPEGLPTVSAEPQTNSLVIFAGARDLERIREIVKQLDVSGFADMPPARVIALKTGKPSAVAQTIRELYLGRTSGPQTGPRAVLIIGDDAAGALIVRADEERFAQIKALADTLQQQGEIGRVAPHVVRLRTVPAARLRQTLLATFTETAKAQGETLAIEVDRSSNSLVIACSSRLLDQIRAVIDELDQADLGAGAEPGGISPALAQSVTIIDVVNNDPAQVRRILEEMGVTRAPAADRVGVVSEPVTITLLTTRRALAVLAAPADGRIVESLVRAIDAAPADSTQQVAFIPLRKASAEALVRTLTAMLSPTGEPAVASGPGRALAEHVRRLQLLKTGVEQAPGLDLTHPIRLLADAGANALIIASSAENIEALRDVVRTMDTLPVGDAVVVRIFVLENASATRVQTVVEGLFRQGEQIRRLPGTERRGLPPTATGQALAGEIAIAIDERTNSLVVAGREEAVALVEVLLKDLDSERVSNWIEPSVIPLKHADARALATKLTDVLVRGLAATPEAIGLQKQFGRLRIVDENKAPGQPGGVLEADLFAPVTGLVINADEEVNALIVIGTPRNAAVVKRLVSMLDVEAASAANTVRVFPLRYAAADRVAAVVKDVFSQRERAETNRRPEDALIVATDVRTNSLIVSTSARSFAILDGLLKTLDGEKANFSVGIHVIPVTNMDARVLAPRLERLMRDRIQAAAQSGSVRNPLDAFSVEAEPVSNLLIVTCSDENLAVVHDLIAALTADADRLAAGERVDLIQLRKARAGEVAQSLQSLYIQKEVERRGQGAVTATPNERLNALIVSGTERDITELRAMAARLDGAEVSATQQVRWIELKSADASEVVALLESVLAGRPLGGNRALAGRQATRLQFIRDAIAQGLDPGQPGRKPTEADIDGAVKDQVTLTPDNRTNSLWITAPEPVMNLIVEMVEDIEKSSAGARKIEYFRLKNADARQMAVLLRDTFSLRQQGDALVLVPAPSRRDRSAADQPDSVIDGSSVTPIPDSRQQLAIAVDLRTNTLVVSGTEEYLLLVRKLVTEIDAIQANERERRVYHLRNAKAKEIETTLQSYFKGDSDMTRATLGPNLQGSLLRQLEEEVTVVGDEKSNKLVISTSPRYMETVLNIVKELDAAPPQVQIQVLLAEVTLDNSDTWGMDINVGPFGGEAYRIGTLAGQAGVATSLGVPNLAISSADFGLLIRSLQAQGKLEVLSNPQVMVNNNQIATINVGEDVAIVDGVERFSQGNSTAIVKRQNVGIILKVTPSISADGFVRMEVSPEISQLSQKTTQISADVASPIITQRKVETVVTVKDGQSVVLGGLIQTTQEQRRTKMPIIGDVPILGLPFRSWQINNVKTELLMILTPRVIPGQTGYAEELVTDVTESAVNRMEESSNVQDYLERLRQEMRRKAPPDPDQPPAIPPPAPMPAGEEPPR